jgi:hypothetical protein
MSLRITAWVWEQSASRGSDRLVALALADRADDAGACFPSVRDIAHRAGISERTAQRSLDALVALGELRREPRHDPTGRVTTRLYTLGGGCQIDTLGGCQIDTGEGVTRVTGEGVTRVTPLTVIKNRHKEPIARTASAAPAERRADPLFEAICAVAGIDWHELTSAGRGAVNQARKELAAVGATPEEVHRRAARWPFSVTLTAPGLAKHWAELGHDQAAAAGRHSGQISDAGGRELEEWKPPTSEHPVPPDQITEVAEPIREVLARVAARGGP